MGAILAVIWAGLSRLFASQAGRWLGTALLWLGIGFATKEAVVDPIMGYLQNGFSGLPAIAAEWVGFFNVDKYASIVASAYLASAGKRVIMRRVTGA